MSATIIFAINENGHVIPYKEFRNAELITKFVWTNIISRFRETNRINSNQKVMVCDKEVIRVIKSGQINLELFELATAAMTFDRAIVKREYFLTLATFIEQFVHKYPGASRTNLLFQAIVLRELYQQADIIGACWQHGEDNPWTKSSNTNETTVAYNIYKDLNHWFMFVDGFTPPTRRKKEKRMVKISISYDIDDDVSQAELDSLAEQYRTITSNFLNKPATPIKVDVSKINKRMILGA